MPRLSASISEEQEAWIDEKVGEGNDYESKSALVRDCINRYEKVEELEAEASDLRRQLREVNAHNDDVDELATYVEEERDLQRIERRKSNAPLAQRVKWLIFGYDDE